MKTKWILIAYAAIGLCAIYLAVIFPGYNYIVLPHAVGDIRVQYLRNYNGEVPAYLSELAHTSTEEEAFQEHNPAFQGKITRIRNIRAIFNGKSDITCYLAIAKIQVENVYAGNLSTGDTVTVLLPLPIVRNIWVEHTEIVSHFRAGMRGIFLPEMLDDSSCWKKGNASLYLSDLAAYSLNGGYTGVFLETRDKLLFNRSTYTSLSPDATLEEAGVYVSKMIEKYK